MLAELKGVGVRRRSDFKGKNQFMARAVECPHAAIVFHPNNQVLELRINTLTCCKHLRHVPPIHAHEVNGPINTGRDKVLKTGLEERREFSDGHLP